MIRFLMIARVLYDKGYSEYIEAAKTIRQEFPETEFMLAGAIDNTYPKHVPQEIVDADVKAGHLNYLGYNNDIRPIIEEIDCIVHPSYFEGMSRVLMEGLAMSKPIITTNIPGCKEMVDDGVNGLLCKPKDAQSLIEALRKFLKLSEAEKQEMGRKGRKKAEKQFDIRNVINVYHEITDRYIKCSGQ